MRARTIIILSALVLAAPASAMSVAEFTAKADALKAKGMLALFSSDLSLLKGEAMGATKAWRAQLAPPGQPPNACPPPGPLRMDSDAFLALLTAVPPPQRASTSVTQAVVAGMNRRYPCRAPGRP